MATPPLLREGDRALSAILESDYRTLYRLGLEHEKAQVGWTETSVKAVLEKIVAPALKGASKVGSAEATVTGNGTQVGMMQELMLPDGRRRAITATVVETERGPRFYLCGLLLKAWNLSFIDERKRLKSQDALTARLSGIKRDKKFLLSIGVGGLAGRAPGQPFRTWQELESIYSAEIERLNALEVAPDESLDLIQ